MEYQVPQFIDIEDKIVGPLTLKQFLYLAGTAGICVISFSFLPLIFAVLISLPAVGLGVALSFYKINGKSFVEMFEAAFNYYTSKKLMLWKYTEPTIQETQASASAAAASDSAAAAAAHGAPRLTSGKLAELAWSLDVKSPSNKATAPTQS